MFALIERNKFITNLYYGYFILEIVLRNCEIYFILGMNESNFLQK